MAGNSEALEFPVTGWLPPTLADVMLRDKLMYRSVPGYVRTG